MVALRPQHFAIGVHNAVKPICHLCTKLLDPTQWIKGNQIRHFPTFYYCKVLTISLQKYMCILCVYVRIDCKSFQPYYYCNELIDAVEALISKFGFCRNSHRLRQGSAIVIGLTATIPAPLPSFLCTEIAQ